MLFTSEKYILTSIMGYLRYSKIYNLKKNSYVSMSVAAPLIKGSIGKIWSGKLLCSESSIPFIIQVGHKVFNSTMGRNCPLAIWPRKEHKVQSI